MTLAHTHTASAAIRHSPQRTDRFPPPPPTNKRNQPTQNSYGTGLTDWDNCSMYGKLALFIFAAWAGAAVRTGQRASGLGWLLAHCVCQVSRARVLVRAHTRQRTPVIQHTTGQRRHRGPWYLRRCVCRHQQRRHAHGGLSNGLHVRVSAFVGWLFGSCWLCVLVSSRALRLTLRLAPACTNPPAPPQQLPHGAARHVCGAARGSTDWSPAGARGVHALLGHRTSQCAFGSVPL